MNNLIKKILVEWSYRLDDGIIDLENYKHLSILREVLNDMELSSEVIIEVMSNITEKEKEWFYAIKKDTKKTSRFGSKETRDAAIKAGTHTAVDKKDDKVKGQDLFKTDTPTETELEVDEKSEIGTTDNWKSEIEQSEKKIKTLKDKLEKAKKTGDNKKIAKAQKELDKEIRKKEGFEMNQKVNKGLNEGSLDSLTESQNRVENLRDKGIAGAGGKKASQGESRTVNAANTLPKYKDQYSDEEGVKKVNDKKEQIKNRVNKNDKNSWF